MLRIAPLIGSTLLLAACSDGPPTYHQDIQPLLEARCVGCHQDGNIGPFPLERYEDVKAVAKAMAAAVQDRRMPPWSARKADVTYRNDVSLTDEQITKFVEWADQGALEGDPATPGQPLPSTDSGLKQVDFEVQLPEPYTPKNQPDEYRCFPISWPETETTVCQWARRCPG